MPQNHIDASPASPQLFQLCAAHQNREEYWEQFVQRFNSLLVSSIITAWRRNGQGSWPPKETVEDLLQETYTAILKNDAALLHNFRGTTEAEAKVYLIKTAINITTSHLRSVAALKRSGNEISLQELIEEQGEATLPTHRESLLHKITEREFLEVLSRLFPGSLSRRDILIFLLYAREGYSPSEISQLKICDLKASSIANLLAQMKIKLKKYFAENL